MNHNYVLQGLRSYHTKHNTCPTIHITLCNKGLLSTYTYMYIYVYNLTCKHTDLKDGMDVFKWMHVWNRGLAIPTYNYRVRLLTRLTHFLKHLLASDTAQPIW